MHNFSHSSYQTRRCYLVSTFRIDTRFSAHVLIILLLARTSNVDCWDVACRRATSITAAYYYSTNATLILSICSVMRNARPRLQQQQRQRELHFPRF